MEKRVTKMIDIRKINQSTYIFINDGNTYIHLGMVIQGVYIGMFLYLIKIWWDNT